MKISQPIFMCINFLLGCTNSEFLRQHNQDSNRGYFTDASECTESSMRKQALNVPLTGGTKDNPAVIGVTNVEIPLGYDANIFLVCMKHAGRPVPHVDATDYLNASTTCLQKAQATSDPDEGYADCIKRSRLDVEIINDK
jgi:hypothetical protein